MPKKKFRDWGIMGSPDVKGKEDYAGYMKQRGAGKPAPEKKGGVTPTGKKVITAVKRVSFMAADKMKAMPEAMEEKMEAAGAKMKHMKAAMPMKMKTKIQGLTRPDKF